MSRAEFDAAMPREFWREVVDRVAAEAPDTLLLAEAFWLLEGYFVRTLGMHRVYNSAFMNMLRDERNAEYRQLIRSTLEFDPADPQTLCQLHVQPGRAHRRRPVRRRRQVLRRRDADGHHARVADVRSRSGRGAGGKIRDGVSATALGRASRTRGWCGATSSSSFRSCDGVRIFAEVDKFLLYDFVTGDGSVDDNVFAYSNEVDGERSLVMSITTDSETPDGRIQLSTAVAKRDSDGDRRLVHRFRSATDSSSPTMIRRFSSIATRFPGSSTCDPAAS